MKMKEYIKIISKKFTNNKDVQKFPIGMNIFYDIETRLSGFNIETIFDVGANIGQSASDYTKIYPNAEIYSFEPIKETYHQLVKNLNASKQVKCFNLAFSESIEEGIMFSEGISTMNYLVNKEDLDSIDPQKIESVSITTIDEFCKSHAIEQISYLKIDTEGSDLKVLNGATKTLKDCKADIIEVEAGLNPKNNYHISFEVLKEILENYNYFIFGIYTQMYEWPEQKPNLRRANTVYISRKVIQQCRGNISEKVIQQCHGK